jgi:hypothetical protein
MGVNPKITIIGKHGKSLFWLVGGIWKVQSTITMEIQRQISEQNFIGYAHRSCVVHATNL